MIHEKSGPPHSRMVGDVFRTYAENTFLVCTRSGRSLTYAETEDEVRSLAQYMDRIMPGRSPVAFLAENSVDYILTCLAFLYSGRSVFLLSPDWPEATLLRHLEDLDVSYLATDRSVTRYSSCIREGDLENGIEVGRFGTDTVPRPAAASDPNQSAPRVHVATSGTTGLSKWVPKELGPIHANLTAWAKRLALSPSDRVHSMLPLCTANGIYITFLMPFFRGATVVLDRRFSMSNLKSCFENIVHYESTVLSTVPTMIYASNLVLGDDFAEWFSNATKARMAICGTAPLSPDKKHRFADRLSVPVLLNFGTTETLFVASQSPSDWQADNCGRPLEGTTVEFEADGQLRIRSSVRFLPYWNRDPGGFQSDGSYLTGDLGTLENGRLRITGRKTDMVIVGGFNVHPAEIDRVIVTAPDVLDCFTFGAPNAITGEELVTAIVLRGHASPGAALTTVRAQLNEVFPDYKIPRLEAVTEIAKTPTGKPIKREMQMRLCADVESMG